MLCCGLSQITLLAKNDTFSFNLEYKNTLVSLFRRSAYQSKKSSPDVYAV